MAPLRGWVPHRRRLLAKVPHRRWKTMTFLAALCYDRNGSSTDRSMARAFGLRLTADIVPIVRMDKKL
jgi:hypothetical protein